MKLLIFFHLFITQIAFSAPIHIHSYEEVATDIARVRRENPLDGPSPHICLFSDWDGTLTQSDTDQSFHPTALSALKHITEHETALAKASLPHVKSKYVYKLRP